MIVLGLTGSIAMGKSTVTRQFAQEGIATADADSIVHDLLVEDAQVIADIARVFPQAVENGVVNRRLLGAAVFGDEAALKQLEAILHPRVREVQKAFIRREQEKGAAMVVLDIPLLYETGGDKRVDKVVVVTASPEIQRQRVLAREGMTEERFRQILSRQMPDAQKRERADFIIHTDKGLAHSREQVQKIIRKLKEE